MVPLIDTMAVQRAITDEEVTGRIDWRPQAKDRMLGTLQGRMEGDRLTEMYTYPAEGMTATEQRVFQVGTDHISVLSGEMEERKGVWVWKDPANAVHGMRVPEVNCR